jgi:hypothetical protein
LAKVGLRQKDTPKVESNTWTKETILKALKIKMHKNKKSPSLGNNFKFEGKYKVNMMTNQQHVQVEKNLNQHFLPNKPAMWTIIPMHLPCSKWSNRNSNYVCKIITQSPKDHTYPI